MANAAPVDAILQVLRGQQRGGGDHDRPELERAQHALPQRDFVAENQQDAVSAPDAVGTQKVRNLRRALRHLPERALQLAAVLVDDPEGGRIVVLPQRIEVVERPVEAIELRPLELPCDLWLIGAVLEQEVARG